MGAESQQISLGVPLQSQSFRIDTRHAVGSGARSYHSYAPTVELESAAITTSPNWDIPFKPADGNDHAGGL